MAAKTWRLVVTELGGSIALHEVTVEAANWMAALTAARSEIGEPGGMPPGAQVAVAPDGKVTIHDPVARRSYALTPDVAKSFTRSKSSGPRIPSDESPPAAKPAPKKTVAYMSSPFEQSKPASTPPPAAKPASVPPPAAVPKPASVPPPAALQKPASVPPPAALQKPASVPPPAALPKPASVPPPAAVQKPASVPPPAALQEPASIPAPVATKSGPPAPLASIGEWSLLSERSEAPTPESPLHYRERTFVVAADTTKERAEAILRERLEESKAEIAGEPPGKFFNFAVFDHAWTERPARPPIVQIQWKDWRGSPEVSYPLEAKMQARAAKAQASAQPVSAPPPAISEPPATAPPSAPPPALQPAPSAAVSAPAPSRPPEPASAAPPPMQPAPTPRPAATGRTRTDEHDARLAHAFEATQDLFFLSTPAEGLDFAVRLIDELIPCEASTACLYDINTDEFRFVALTGPGADERKGEAIPARTGLLGTAAERVGAAYIVPDVSTDARFDPGVDGRVGLEPTTALYMSIHHQGRLLGILQLLNRKDREGFSQADGELVSYVAKQLAEFLYQARIAPDQGARI